MEHEKSDGSTLLFRLDATGKCRGTIQEVSGRLAQIPPLDKTCAFDCTSMVLCLLMRTCEISQQVKEHLDSAVQRYASNGDYDPDDIYYISDAVYYANKNGQVKCTITGGNVDMPIDRDILSKVKRLAAEKSDAMMADKLFQSSQFLSYAQSAINSVTGRYKTKVKLKAYHGELDGDTAATDKRTIILNTHHQRKYFFDSLLNKFMSQMGGIFHECAFVLYMNFDIWKNQFEAMQNGTFLEVPAAQSNEEQEGLDALTEALQTELYRPMLMNVYHSVYNSLQDGHDEDKMIAEAVPFVGQCILMRREAKQAEFPSVEEMVDRHSESELYIMFSLILEASLFEDIYMEDPNTAMSLEPM